MVEKYTVHALSGNGHLYKTYTSENGHLEFQSCVYTNPDKNYAVSKMSRSVKAWPESLIKNKSQRYERSGTTTVKPLKRDWQS